MVQKNKYAFIVLNWNGERNTTKCLDSLNSVNYHEEFDVILVDNGSLPRSLTYIKKHINKKIDIKISIVRLNTNKGFTGGHIEGLKHTNADYVCILNNDSVVGNDILNNVDSVIREIGNGFGAIGGRAYFWNNEQKAYDPWNEFFTHQKIDPITGTAYTIKGDPNESVSPKVVDNVSGACVFINRIAIESAGYLDDRFFAYYEETDLFARFKRCGYEIYYCPTVRYWHIFDPNEGSHGASSKHIKNFSLKLIVKNQFIFAVKNFEKKYLYKFFIWYYTRFFLCFFKSFIKKHRNLSKVIMQTTILNTLNLPSIYKDRLDIYNNSMVKYEYNSKIISNNQKKTIVIKDKIKNDIVKLISNKTEANNRIHFITSNECDLDLPHRCIFLHSSQKNNLYSLSLAASRTNFVVIIEGDNYNYSDLLKEFARIDNNEPYRRKRLDIFSYNRAFGYQLVGKELQIDEFNNWMAKPNKSKNIMPKQIIKVIKKLKSVYRLILDYLSFRYRYGGIFDLIRSLLGIIKNSFIKPRETLEIMRAGAHKQRLYTQRNKTTSDHTEKLGDFLPSEIPVFINCRDRVISLKKTIASIRHAGFSEIYLIDNNSTYKPLLSYYKTCSEQVIPLGENMGHKAPWESLAVKLLSCGRPYVVTDPDITLSKTYNESVVSKILKLFDEFPGYVKIGPALEINNLPDEYIHKNTVQNWEKQFWKKKIKNINNIEVFDAEIDTTFAIYRPNLGYITLPSLRVGGNYTAKHLPWYQDSKNPNKEEKYYRVHASSAVNTWDKDSVPEYLQGYIE